MDVQESEINTPTMMLLKGTYFSHLLRINSFSQLNLNPLSPSKCTTGTLYEVILNKFLISDTLCAFSRGRQLKWQFALILNHAEDNFCVGSHHRHTIIRRPGGKGWTQVEPPVRSTM